ncbi:serine/threonine protein phosphatase [Pseudonocardia kujensis]|uniref:PP2C family protein-serine/threonine phosphatase n=1 Tax=Pseudonocardia kujensis TaxID=1128675 RepID=UPI001E31BA7D|nr:serine/threonine protein phosphatase [Pseudonocardia kujensis]MCE0768580.1 serine/threonine protein phosphatase [Pseudonocardia kujensis]
MTPATVPARPTDRLPRSTPAAVPEPRTASDTGSPTLPLRPAPPRRGRGPAGSASVRGLRHVAADALAAQGVGRDLAVAVADGIGDSAAAAVAARVSADVAAAVAPRAGSLEGLLAARDAVRLEPGADDAVMVVAAGLPGGGWSVSWVGDCRALLVTDRGVALLTHDHTVAQYLRDRGKAEDVVPAWENVVMTTVGSVDHGTVGHAEGPAGPGTLVLVSDGVHRALDEETIAFLVRRADAPARAAHDLVEAALTAGSRDNASATVVPLPEEWTAP